MQDVLAQGVWSPVSYFDSSKAVSWHAELVSPDGSEFVVMHDNKKLGTVSWDLLGIHNVNNALAAIAAATHANVVPEAAIEALHHLKMLNVWFGTNL